MDVITISTGVCAIISTRPNILYFVIKNIDPSYLISSFILRLHGVYYSLKQLNAQNCLDILFILGRNIEILREQNSSCLRFLSVRRTVTCCCLMEVRHRRILFKIKVYSPTLPKTSSRVNKNIINILFPVILSHQTKIRN